jgi:hypothetical protein
MICICVDLKDSIHRGYTRKISLMRCMSLQSGGGCEQPMEAGVCGDWAEAVVNGPLPLFVGDGDGRRSCRSVMTFVYKDTNVLSVCLRYTLERTNTKFRSR